ncbi:tripartite tricarboxylate transporter substrate binding protein [Hydrogenophaga sp.]|uniref:Bug family tripartite tricarboxylate transporter substrate binding protein n=1 Tax=Hydrogenophaga sp. TaxID=1904254 RepID=UPI00271A70B7|nr:tripartite tricarboxylate transporter substrate binding protein [Hydrogenophaga sp.]MDO9434880.1 tripartite tricarboxylate transporter substrate binding protein [Hydrogenophaga sp.]
MNRRTAIQRTAWGIAALTTLGTASAQQTDHWPSRVITMVVPAAAGSGTDLMAREMASRLAAVLKQPVILDNKPGGSGVPGIQAVVRAAPDGYTLLYSNGSMAVMAPALVKTLPYNVVRDLVPIAQTAEGGVMLLVNNDFPAKNLQELIQVVKANPGVYSYGSWAVGSSGHLTMEWLKRQTGMDIAHVGYKATPQLLTDLMAGNIKIGWADPAAPIPFVESGKMRAIAVTGKTRLSRTPNVPTMGEQGHAFDAVGWFGVFAPAGTPKAIVQRLNEEIMKIQALPEMGVRVKSMNIAVPPNKTPDQFRSLVVEDTAIWKKIVTETGITLDN